MNIKIRNIEIECAEKTVSNDYFIDHFKKQGKEIDGLLSTFGKNQRKMIAGTDDTAVSLSVKVAKKIMKNSGLTGEDIDMVIFSSQFPEYTMPTQALIIHKAIGCKQKAMIMDTNANCVGMLVAMDNAIRYLKEKDDFKRALIVGCDVATIHCKKSDELTYPMWGDCASAIILEKTDEDSGFVGSTYRTDSSEWDVVKFPKCGLSNIYGAPNDDKKILWNPFKSEFVYESSKESIFEILDKHKIPLNDIKAFCFSQFAFPMLEGIRNTFDVEKDKFIYIGDKYGYTGTSSPFIALYEAIKSGKVKRGDYIALWSVGIYWTTCAVVLKY